MGSSITGKAYSLKDLFEKSFYRIDYYQRECAWSADDVWTLVNDMTRMLGEYWQDGRRHWQRSSPDHFFMGPFVYVESHAGFGFWWTGSSGLPPFT
jgi:hypothetical protein